MNADSNSYELYTEPDMEQSLEQSMKMDDESYMSNMSAGGPHKFDVIEIDNSDDDESKHSPPVMDESNYDYNTTEPQDFAAECQSPSIDDTDLLVPMHQPQQQQQQSKNNTQQRRQTTPNNFPLATPNQQLEDLHNPSPISVLSNPSSPLLTPLEINGKTNNGEVTLEAIPSQRKRPLAPEEIITNATKRKAMNAPIPVLTPINDPIELYCLSLVDSLRNMPRSERERVKFEFAKILKDAKYKNES